MGNAKFSMNSVVLIVIIFSAIIFFITVFLVNATDPFAVNEFFKIEGTDLGIKHSNLDPDGIYRGMEGSAELVLEGNYGNDWGTTYENGSLYLNEYSFTTVGMIVPEVVKVNTESFEKELLYKNAIIRGRCKSGEMVILESYIIPSNSPKTNSLYKFYCHSSRKLEPDSEECSILFVDPKTGEVEYQIDDANILEKSFDMKYIERTLDEIREEDAA